MNQRVEYNVVEFSEEAKSAFRKSLEASFIGSEKKPDDRFAPRILSNNDPASNVLSVIKGEFLDCVSFDLSVAFITASGIQVLAEILSQLRQRGIKGRILTSTYLCFNDPDALRKLLEYPNIETRVYQGDLHAKGYFFNKRGISTIIIGSSNLTQTALTCNKEWNVLFRSFPTGDIAHKTKAEFEKRSYQRNGRRKTPWRAAHSSGAAQKFGRGGQQGYRSLSKPRIRRVKHTYALGEFSTRGEQLARKVDGKIVLNPQFETALSDPWFRSCVSDVLEFGLSRNEAAFAETYKDTDFVLNQKYTREDVCRLLRWAKEPNYQNVGGYFHDKETNTFPVFINYEKDPDISVTTQYEDRFVSDREIICISKSNRTLQSPEIGNLAHARELGMRCFLFLRKNKKDKDDGTEFYFLGEMHPTGHFEQIVMEDVSTSAVEITYDLETPVRADLYDYFLSSFDK